MANHLYYKTLQMTHYKENDMVIYTDNEGNRFDTFVIFDTDRQTGLTHINHLNLMVENTVLELHPQSVNGCTIPMNDTYSFELFRQLKQKFITIDNARQKPTLQVYRDIPTIKLAKAS
ncbi:MAG: hypothetical protein ABI367_12720 [Mucilaginibacter sp.]